MFVQYLVDLLLLSLQKSVTLQRKHLSWRVTFGLMLWLSWGMADPAPTTDAARITACLNALITAQDAYFASSGRYTQHENLLGTLSDDVCEGVTLTTFTDFSLESGYFITGRIGDTAYNATPDSGITAAVPMQRAELGVLRQLATCLNRIATSQELHYIDFNRYGNYGDLVSYGWVDACDGVDFTEQSVSDDNYLYLGDVSGCVLQVTPRAGISVARDDGCPQTFDFASLIGLVLAHRASACLKEIATSQEVYLINNNIYATYAQLIDANGAIDVCEGVALTERVGTVSEYEYNEYIARVEACVLRLTTFGGIVDLNDGGCPQTITFDAVEGRNLDESPVTLKAFATSRLPVTFTSITPDVCEVGGTYGEQVMLISAGTCTIHADQAGNDMFQAAVRRTQRFTVLPVGADAGNGDTGSGSSINPNPDMQIRNGSTLAAESITSGTLEPLHYGTFKRGQAVTLTFLVRNPGQQILEIGELGLPSFLSNAGDTLPDTLDSFASVLLSLTVDTSTAGQFTGQISLASNDPDSFENPFVFDVVVTVSDEPANALYVLPGVDLADVVVSAGQKGVPLMSFYVSVPAGSVPVTVDSFTLAASDAVARASELRLYIDGGTRGQHDNRDVLLSRLATTETLTFSFEARTFAPATPMWFLLVGDF